MMSSGSSFGPSGEQFPVGLRVLVVDDDVTCLKILEHMLRSCRYRVTTCCQATVALSLLRERRGDFDVVISDVHMPDMNGFKLLELVGLEMDLPVIMMSADGGTNTVMRGITHGACDYLIKPVRIEELKNIWQHVIRKKCNDNRVLEYSGSMDDSDHSKRVAEDNEYASSVNDGADGPWKSHKKKRDATDEEEDGEVDHEDPSSKKPRVVWSVELHQQFVSAVSHLGIEKAVPKRILELMNVPGLTRENVASHLQKFRLYLKRISGVVPYQNGLPTSICGPMEPNTKVGSVGRLDFQALAASGQIPTQTLAALHAELLGHPSGSLALPAIAQPVLHASREGPKCIPAEREVAYGQPLFKCQLSISKQFPPTSVAIENASTGFLAWSSNHLGTTDSIKNIEGLNNTQNSKIMMPILQQQQPYHVITEPQHVINVQPSCLVVPSQSSNSVDVRQSSLHLNRNSTVVPSQLSKTFQSGNTSPASNPNPNLNGSNVVLNYSLFSSLSNSASLGVLQASDGDITNLGVLNGSPGTISSSVASCSARTNIDCGWRVHHQNMNPSTGLHLKLPNLCTQEPVPNTWRSSEPGQARNHGFVGKGTFIPSRFAVDDIDSPTNDQISRSTHDDGARVKQELHLDFTDASNFIGVLSQ